MSGQLPATSNRPKICFNCGKLGHAVKLCRLPTDSEKIKENYANWKRERFGKANQSQRQSRFDQHRNTGGVEDDQIKIMNSKIEKMITAISSMVPGFEKAFIVERCQGRPTGDSGHGPSDWFIDSGASAHMVWHRDWLVNMQKCSNRSVKTADGTLLDVHAVGDCVLFDDKHGSRVVLPHVLFVPGLQYNLFSVGKAMDSDFSVEFRKSKTWYSGADCIIRYENCRIITPKRNQVWWLPLNTASWEVVKAYDMAASMDLVLTPTMDDNYLLYQLWHRRLGHVGHQSMQMTLRRNGVSGIHFDIDNIGYHSTNDCETCTQGKRYRRKFGGDIKKGTQPLECVHSDVCGPIVRNRDTHDYFVTFTDDFTGFMCVYPVKGKDASELAQCFQEYILKMGIIAPTWPVKVLHSDNGGEYENETLKKFCLWNGIEFSPALPHASQSAGLAEKANSTIMNHVRCLMFDAGLENTFWQHALFFAVFVRNRVISQRDRGNGLKSQKTPFEQLVGVKPDLSKLRIFGCLCYCPMYQISTPKLDAVKVACTYLGVVGQGGRCVVLQGGPGSKPVERRFKDITFFEGQKGPHSTKPKSHSITADHLNPATSISPYTQPGSQLDDMDMRSRKQNYVKPINRVTRSSTLSLEELADRKLAAALQRMEDDDLGQDYGLMAQVDLDTSDYTVMNGALLVDGRDCTCLPNCHCESCSLINIALSAVAPDGMVHILSGDIAIPRTLNEALKSKWSDKWIQAMRVEMQSIVDNDVFDVVALPSGRSTVGCKWVFDLKVNEHGYINRFKARLVAQGYTQQEGIDYHVTYSPVLSMRSFRLLIAVAATLDLDIRHVDVETAFLNGDLDEEVYMDQPLGLEPTVPGKVWRLKKALYGLKQAGRMWYLRWRAFMLSQEFRQSIIDECIFVKVCVMNGMTYLLIIGIFVDDIFMLGDSVMAEMFLAAMRDVFRFRDMGELKFFLGIHVERDRANKLITIHQQLFAQQMLVRFKMESCNGTKLPANGVQLIPANDDEELYDVTSYKELIGSLMYLMTCTRPDLAYSVIAAASFMERPNETHYKAAKQILRHVRQTINLGIKYDGKLGTKVPFPVPTSHQYEPIQNLVLYAYTDSNYGNIHDGKSTAGHVTMLAGGAISYRSVKLKTVATSTTESEFNATKMAMQEISYIRLLLDSIGFKQLNPTILYGDNQASIKTAHGQGLTKCSKHYAQHVYYVRQRITEKEIEYVYIGSEENAADIFTKAITSHEKFKKLREMLGLVQAKPITRASTLETPVGLICISSRYDDNDRHADELFEDN